MKRKYKAPFLTVALIKQEDGLLMASVYANPGGTSNEDVYYIPLVEESSVNDSWVIE